MPASFSPVVTLATAPDVVSFPRTNRIGGAIEKPEPIGGGGRFVVSYDLL